MSRPRLLLLMSRVDCPHKDLAAMTLGWMAQRAGVEFDTYYAADHKEGGLFAPYGSSVIGGHHGARIARALATFETTVVRLGGLSVFDSLCRAGAARIISVPEDLGELYAKVADCLALERPTLVLRFDTTGTPPAVFYPDCVGAMALAWEPGCGDQAVGVDQADPALECVMRHVHSSEGIDLYEPVVASHMLAFNQRARRLILPYRTREEAIHRAGQLLELVGRRQEVAYGRWFGDPQLLPLAQAPMAYNVVEPNRHILSVFSRSPLPLPQPPESWMDAEPSDQELQRWASEKRILASWVLHSGELSHDDSVLGFLDWSSMTKVKIGAGVHWQRYHFDPDVVEPLHTPAAEGGVLELVEPVLHSAGAGIMWETAGDAQQIAGLMQRSRQRIVQVAGERFAPRGVYCFGDHYAQPEGSEPGAAQLALWKAIHAAGFEYVVSSALPGESRILYQAEGFVVLNQAGEWHSASPFVRGAPHTYARQELDLAAANRPGWLLGAIDTPIHGCPIYVGRPYGGDHPQARLSDFYDYVQKGGQTGRVVSATPHTIARYARLLGEAGHGK